MKRSSLFPLAVLVGSIVFLAVGLGRFLELEFSGGTMYPVGSSMRADPHGTMILYESLEELSGVEVLRNTDSIGDMLEDLDPENAVVMLLNTDPYWLVWDQGIAGFVREGGIVVASPNGKYTAKDDLDHFRPIDFQTGEREESDPEEADPLRLPLPTYLNERRWETDDVMLAERTDVLNDTAAPEQIEWPAGRRFFLTDLEEEDRPDVLYELDGNPVAVEYQEGDGRVILLADTALLSNEAMYLRRRADWLTWLLEQGDTVVFDEFHFGTATPRGLAALMWSFNLQGLFIALAVPFFLLLWHGAVPLLPTVSAADELDVGRQSRLSGFRDLLRRHIPAPHILRHCLQEWKQTFLHTDAERERFADLVREAEHTLQDPGTRRGSASSAGYQRLHSLLTRKRTRL